MTLLHPSRELVPWSVQIPWERRPVEGERVECSEGLLRIGLREIRLSGNGLELALGASPMCWRTLAEQLGTTELPERTAVLLGRGEVPPGVEGFVIEAARRGLARLVAAIASLDANAADLASAVRRLTGLGPGSTPTGDDLLVGVAAVGHRLAGAGMAAAGWKLFVEALRALPREATTPVAREMIDHAAAGVFAAPLGAVAAALGDAAMGMNGLRPAVARLENVGAQSGSDMMAGAWAMARAALEAQGG